MNARPPKQSMSELKLRRLTEHNQRLREDLERPRVRVSEASIGWVPLGVIIVLRRSLTIFFLSLLLD